MKLKKEIIITAIVIVIAIGASFGIKYFLNKDLEDQKKELEENIDKYGVVERESVDTTVAKFNTQIKDNSSLNPAMNDYLTIDNGEYWYGLIEGVYCYAIPEEFSGDKTKDITEQISIYYEKDSKYKEAAVKYIRYLIKANNSEITETEIDELIKNAEELSKEGKTVNNGKGISLGIFEGDTYFSYQINRYY